MNFFESINMNSGRAIQNFAWAISAPTQLCLWAGFSSPVAQASFFFICEGDSAPNRKVSWTVLSLNSLSFLLEETVKTKQYGLEKHFFPICWQLQTWGGLNNTDTEHRSRKDWWKTKDTDREEQDTGRVALLCWELCLYKS